MSRSSAVYNFAEETDFPAFSVFTSRFRFAIRPSLAKSRQCGRGGIGRRAALRSLFLNRSGSSSLLDRTKILENQKQNSHAPLVAVVYRCCSVQNWLRVLRNRLLLSWKVAEYLTQLGRAGRGKLEMEMG